MIFGNVLRLGLTFGRAILWTLGFCKVRNTEWSLLSLFWLCEPTAFSTKIFGIPVSGHQQ